MNRQLIIRAEAEDDLTEAFTWYENRRPGLGVDLTLAVEATLAQIRRRPESFPALQNEVRRALLKRFPYGVFFLVGDNAISVIAIFHAKRDPRIWQQRAER